MIAEPSNSAIVLSRSWCVDETYIRVHARWKYLYRAIDRDGALVDVMLSEHRDLAAESLLSIGQGGHWRHPGPSDDGRSRRVSPGNPDRARKASAASDKPIPE